MVDAGLDAVVMEVSSQALMLHRVSGFVFDIGVFTNLEPDHIGEMEFLMGTASICRAFYRDIPVQLRRLGMEQKMI